MPIVLEEFSPETFGTRAGIEQKANGAGNLREYVAGDLDDPQADPEPAWIATAIADDLTEATADMRVAWRENSAEELAADDATMTRWLNDTAEYGALVKAWSGRTVSQAESAEDVPQQIATARAEWKRRLDMLRTGKVMRVAPGGISALDQLRALSPASMCRSSSEMTAPRTCLAELVADYYAAYPCVAGCG